MTSANLEVAPVALASIRAFQTASKAPNTRRGYETHWRAFTAWCASQGFNALPAEPLAVAAYLTYAANLVKADGDWFYAPDTIGHWLGSINKAHVLAGFPKPGTHPDVSTTLEGIRRERARPADRKSPLLLNDLRRTIRAIDLNTWPNGIIGHRDWALLLIGFAGAYRRSELAALELRDVRVHSEDGLHLMLRRSKTDQEGQGTVKGIPFGANPLTCAPCAFVRWARILSAVGEGRSALMRVVRDSTTDVHVCREPMPDVLPAGALFRPVMKNGAIPERNITGNVVNDVVKRRIKTVGLNPAMYGAHSLRAGFVTQAFRAGATQHEVMRQTGHKDVATLELYSRENAPLAHNAVTRLGL